MMIEKASIAKLTIIIIIMTSEASLLFSLLQQTDGNTCAMMFVCLFDGV
jgi:hypothetical protein